MSFLFVDRILKLDPGHYAAGIKHITPSDLYLYRGRLGKPALLPALIGEALGQLGAWSVMRANDFTMRPVAGVVGEVNIHDDAYIGQTLLLETFIDKWDEQAIEYHSVARVGEHIVFTIKHALGPMLPMADFIDEAVVKSQFSMINRPGTLVEEESETTIIPPLAHVPCVHSNFDHIQEWVKGKYVVAQKKVSLSAPYFADHFPRKPVLPLTILMNCKLKLAREFLADAYNTDETTQFIPMQLRKIKMNEFVSPGSIVKTRLQLDDPNRPVVTFRSEVEGKRVCTAEAEFEQIQTNTKK